MKLKQIQFAVLATLAMLFAGNNIHACDLSSATLNNVVSVGNGEYLITVTYCAGSGRSSTRYGGDQNSAAFGFHLIGATYATTTPLSPLSVTSSSTGAIYDGYIYDPTWAIYDNYLSQWWACINGGCGPLGSTCATITLRTVGLPTAIECGGAEAAGVVVPPYGCNGQPDMIVHPICYGFVVNAGADRTVYRGYAPQACTTITAAASGISGPFTYSWSTGATTASINVCPIANTTYTCTVTASNGCVQTDAVVVTVVDVRCSGNKVKVCHGTQNKCYSSGQVAGHLAHGDRLGNCTNKTDSFDDEAVAGLTLYPNPASGEFTIQILSEIHGSARIDIFGMNGSVAAQVFEGSIEADTEMEFTQDLSSFAPGLYMVRFISPDGTTEMKKLIVNP